MSRALARIGLSLPVIVAAVLVFLAAGTWLGGHFLVPEGQGLAAPAEALGYGLVCGLLGLALSIFAAVRLPLRVLAACALAGIVAIAALAVVLTLAARAADRGRDDGSVELQIFPATTEPAQTGESERA